jgi:hypothetical protein
VSVEVEREQPRVEADVTHDALGVMLCEVAVDARHLLEEVHVGREARGGAVEEDHVLHVEHQVLRQLGSLLEKTFQEILDLVHQLVAGHPGGILHRLIHLQHPHERVDVGIHRQRAQITEGCQLPADVVDGTGQHHAQEREALRLGHPAGDAVVEQRDASLRHHEQVAAVKVAVEDAVDHRALEERDQQGAHQLVGVDPGAVHPLDVLVLEPVETLHHEHPSRDQLRMRSRHDDDRLASFAQQPGDVEHVLRFQPEVQLLDDGLGEQLDEGRRIAECRHRDASHQERRDPCHGLDVAAHEPRDAGTLDLDDDLLAAGQPRRMDLRDRRRGDRRLLQGNEDLRDRPAEVLLDDATDHGERLGRNLVAAALELVDELGRKQPLPRRHDLAELDVRGAEALERAPQPSRQPRARGGPARAALAQLPARQRQAEHGGRLAEPPERWQHAAPDEHRNLGLRRRAQLIDAGPPGQALRIDLPRAVIAEGAEGQIGWRRDAHPPLLPVMAPGGKPSGVAGEPPTVLVAVRLRGVQSGPMVRPRGHQR